MLVRMDFFGSTTLAAFMNQASGAGDNISKQFPGQLSAMQDTGLVTGHGRSFMAARKASRKRALFPYPNVTTLSRLSRKLLRHFDHHVPLTCAEALHRDRNILLLLHRRDRGRFPHALTRSHSGRLPLPQ